MTSYISAEYRTQISPLYKIQQNPDIMSFKAKTTDFGY
jgi:hypothetical protein